MDNHAVNNTGAVERYFKKSFIISNILLIYLIDLDQKS